MWLAPARNIKRGVLSEGNETRLVTASFNKKKVSHSYKDLGPKFKFLGVWQIIHDYPKLCVADLTSSTMCSIENRNKNIAEENDESGSEQTPSLVQSAYTREFGLILEGPLGRQRQCELREL